MKNYLIITVLMFLSLSSLAQNSWDKANDFYKNEKYEQAIVAYKSILPAGNESAEIFYNLGNAYYKNGEIAQSILNYERALLIQPNFSDAQFNLGFAQSKTIDKINKADNFFFHRWIDSLANIMSSNAWAILSIVLFIICLGLIFVYVFLHILTLRKISFYTFLILFSLSISGVVFAKMQKDKVERREFAIITNSSATVRSSPDRSGTSVFVLHEGTKVKIQNTLDLWLEIKLDDGNVGWILSSDLERI